MADEYITITEEDSLAHHGILGQKWGRKNGPPYPLSAADHSAKEKRLNKGHYSDDPDRKNANAPNSSGGSSHHGHSGGGGGSSSKPKENRNNEQRPETSKSEYKEEKREREILNERDRESKKYRRNLNKQQRLNNRQYEQLNSHQNDLIKKQEDIFKQQRKLENDKAEMFRKELSYEQRERELKQIQKEQRRIQRQQNAQQRAMRRENERRLDDQVNAFRNQNYGSGKGNVSYGPSPMAYSMNIPGMTLDDYRRYRAKRKAAKIAKGAVKTVGKAAAVTGAVAAIGTIGIGALGVYSGRRGIKKLGKTIKNNSELIGTAGEIGKDVAKVGLKNLRRRGDSIVSNLVKGTNFDINGRQARKLLGNINLVNKKINTDAVDIDFDTKKTKRIINGLKQVGNNLTDKKVRRNIASDFADIAEDAANKRKTWKRGIENAITRDSSKKASKKAAKKIANDMTDKALRDRLKMVEVEEVTGSANGNVTKRMVKKMPALANEIIKNPELLDNDRITNAILDVGGQDYLDKIKKGADILKNAKAMGANAREARVNSTGLRGFIRGAGSGINTVSDKALSTKKTYDKAKAAATAVSAMTIGAYTAKRAKRKEQKLRDKIEEEMLDEYFFGRKL